jgi:hypothetical protein
MSKDLISTVTTGTVQELLREAGLEARLAGTKEQPQVVSAVAGINFNVRFGTPAKDGSGWTDFTFSAPFTVDQEVSPVISAFWNRRNRFARVYRTQDQLLLDMDVIVAGGVTRANVKYLTAVWADVAQLFVRHLRADHAVLARYKAAGGKAAAATSAPKAAAPAPTAGAGSDALRQRQPANGARGNGKSDGLGEKAHASGSS